jgi:LCP family protein required for cell wall assembly
LDPAVTVGPTPGRRSPSVAAFLSLLWPGLGHWYGRRPRAAVLFALPVALVVLIVAGQAVGGLAQLASLVITPSSALTVFILIVLLGVWREVAIIDAASGVAPRGAWRRGRSLAVVLLSTAVIAVTHIWAGSVAWAFYDATDRIFVGSEGPDAEAPVALATPGPSGSVLPSASVGPDDQYVAAPFATSATASARINVLLTGVDSAETRSHALTDTLIVASIDPVSHDVALISFPRDIAWFPMVDGRTFRGKINGFMTYVNNHPDEFDDKPLVELADQLSFLIGAPIHYYAAVDLAGFRRLINAAGGVTVTVEEPIDDPRYDWLDGRRGFKLSAGRHRLNGEEALAYVRSRYSEGDTDFNRARRQQQVLLALADKLGEPAMLPRIPELVEVAGDTLRTNFPTTRVTEMLDLAQGVDASKVRQVVLGRPYAYHPPNSETDGIYTLRLRMDRLAELSIELFGDDSAYAQS